MKYVKKTKSQEENSRKRKEIRTLLFVAFVVIATIFIYKEKDKEEEHKISLIMKKGGDICSVEEMDIPKL